MTVLSPEAAAFQIEGRARCLGPSAVELTLPLNAAECPKLPFATVAGGNCRSCPKFSLIHAARFEVRTLACAAPRWKADGVIYSHINR